MHQKDLQNKHTERLREHEKARLERAKLREQHKKAGDLHKLSKAVDALKDACPEKMPRTPAERLAGTQSRIEALLKAADAIRPALEDFYGALTAEQKATFDNLRS